MKKTYMLLLLSAGLLLIGAGCGKTVTITNSQNSTGSATIMNTSTEAVNVNAFTTNANVSSPTYTPTINSNPSSPTPYYPY